MYAVTCFLSGLVFGIGLIVSGMANPAKVLGFLDVAGRWDPSLALVMGGAVAVGIGAFFVAGKRPRSYLGAAMQISTAERIEPRYLLGSLAFGVGWGLVGFCPGPALVSLGSGHVKAVVFVAAMLAGMALYEQLERIRIGRRSSEAARQAALDPFGDR